jgi:predicted PurR-regulated permease PerM
MERVNWQRTRDILISIICIGIIIWFAWGLLLGVFVHTVVLLLLSLALAFLLTPAVNFLQKQGLPRVLATLIMYIVAIAVLGGLGYALTFSLIQQVQTFSSTIINFITNLPNEGTSLIDFLQHQGIPNSSIQNALGQIQAYATEFARTTATNVLNIVVILTNTLIDIFIILVLGFYFTLDGKQVRDNLVSIVPKSWMTSVLTFEDALNRVVGNYIRGQLTLALIVGVLAGLGCTFLGLRSYALIVAVLAFIFETIPMVGPALASIPAILISLLLPDPFPRTLWIVAWFVGIQLIESNILGPRIVGHAVGLHPIASLLALIIFAQLFGPFGALIATPVVAATWVVIASLYRSAHGETADQMLANSRRTGWVIRRNRRRLPPAVKGREHPARVDGPSRPPEKGTASEADAEERTAGPPHSQNASPPPQVKGSALPKEHLDLLRPVPDPKPPQANPDDEKA